MTILRVVAALLVGYIVMAAMVIGGFAAMLVGLGVDRLFKPGSYEASPGFIAFALIISAVSAVAGGGVCSIIARSRIPVFVLAFLVLCFGVLSGTANAAKPDPGPRLPGDSITTLMQKAKQPVWYGYSLGIVGALGTLLGGQLKRR